MTFDTFYDLCNYYYKTMLPGESLATDETVHGETFNIHLYRLADNFVFDSATTVTSVFSLCKGVDAATQIILGKNITVNSGVTLIPPYRCKGLIIFDKGTFTNNGTISMTARGASAKGQNIYLVQNDDGSYEFVPAVGANGGAGAENVWINRWTYTGGAGGSAVGRQTGGGGAGSSFSWTNCPVNVGKGGNGTSYSGGSGAGRCMRWGTSYPMASFNSLSGSDTGGAGGFYTGFDGVNWNNPGPSKGATQSAGGNYYSDFGKGGFGKINGRDVGWSGMGGGGAGWFGGGCPSSVTSNYCACGGAGGSSFVYGYPGMGKPNLIEINGKEPIVEDVSYIEGNNSGAGYCKITILEVMERPFFVNINDTLKYWLNNSWKILEYRLCKLKYLLIYIFNHLRIKSKFI